MSDEPRTVLVADDDEDILQLVSFRLERAGYTVVTAADGQQALAAARQHQPDLVGMAGLAVAVEGEIQRSPEGKSSQVYPSAFSP